MAVYVYRNNQQQGPYEESAVAEGLRSGSLSPDDLACFVGSDRWAPLGSLFPHLPRAPPPPPQPPLPPPPSAHTWMDDSAAARPARPVEPLRPGASPYAPPVQYVPPPVPAARAPYGVPQQAAGRYGEAKGSGLPAGAMSMGILAVCLMLVGLVPCFGWLNWMTLLIGGIGNLLSWAAVFTEKNQDARSKALIGLVLSFIAVFIGGIRLVLGAGCL